jgi:hypothetical protein
MIGLSLKQFSVTFIPGSKAVREDINKEVTACENEEGL